MKVKCKLKQTNLNEQNVICLLLPHDCNTALSFERSLCEAKSLHAYTWSVFYEAKSLHAYTHNLCPQAMSTFNNHLYVYLGSIFAWHWCNVKFKVWHLCNWIQQMLTLIKTRYHIYNASMIIIPIFTPNSLLTAATFNLVGR